jgi:tRNA-Thr(GGU) m(6)t(6)A37 methyltransferase TsaA
MPIYQFEGKRPTIAPTAYVAPTALVIGRVDIGERCYIGHGAILRGDYGAIEIGDESAVEEGVIIHARPEDWTRIGQRVTVGHGAMIHNATIHDGAVIGMRAVISDFSEVGAGAIVGEMSLVKNKQQVPPRKVAVGVPARVVGDVDERHRDMAHWAKDLYVALAGRYAAGGLVELEGAPAAEQAPAGPVVIGVIHTPFRQPGGTPVQGALGGDVEGEVLVDPIYREGLADLDGFSHIVLLYAFHRSSGYRLTVTPYLDTKPRGLFATRAPRRPSAIGMTVVRLIEVSECRLRVGGVDMLDGTPLLDIKPHVPAFDSPSGCRVGWLEGRLQQREGGAGPVADERFHENDGK